MLNKVKKIVPEGIKKQYRKKKAERKVDIYKKSYPKLSIENPKKVSVVIPNYNYAKYIIERIDSVLFQTYPIHELIILDDCSKDNSVDVIKKKIKTIKDIKVKFVPNKKNSGCVFDQWQKAFELSTGDYVWIAEADDSCNPRFLENVMKAFDDEEVVISYAESKRIDENNYIIGDSCREWMSAVSTTRWNESYINEGIKELKESLCVCNSIPNVSAVVFKKLNQIELLDAAKQFTISGDWYLYFELLKQGKIAYCKKSLNYFRKHSNSTSTVAKKSVELEELLKIQKMIRDYAKLDSEMIHKQSFRYGNLIKEVDEKTVAKVEKYIAKKIAWIIPAPIKGSGGIRTMIQNANFLANKGYEVDIYVEEDYVNDSISMKKRIINYYGECNCNVFVGIEMRKQYDLLFATYSILTADYVRHMENVKYKAYFIQDFEPWFEPMGGLYLDMEKTYRFGLQGVSIGKWLTHKISHEFNSPMTSFPFCADLNVYKKLDNIEKENAICFIHQPEKARRCSKLGLQALMLVKKLRPDVKIYLYGADVEAAVDFEVENLHIIPIEKCNELYNKCSVGLCISASNPSRIPFEMMAAGLPVVDVYRENNLYDVPDEGVLLADTSPEAIATALISILDDKKLQKSMSKKGSEFMKDYPLERGYEDFLKAVERILEGEVITGKEVDRIYKKDPVMPSEEVLAINDLIKPIPIKVKPTGRKIRFLVRCKRFIKRKRYELIHKLIK